MSERVPSLKACVFHGQLAACGGRMTKHHLIPKRRIKAQHSYFSSLRDSERAQLVLPAGAERTLRELLDDERNLIDICWNCHQHLENARPGYVILERDWPPGFEDFARELDLFWYLERIA